MESIGTVIDLRPLREIKEYHHPPSRAQRAQHHVPTTSHDVRTDLGQLRPLSAARSGIPLLIGRAGRIHSDCSSVHAHSGSPWRGASHASVNSASTRLASWVLPASTTRSVNCRASRHSPLKREQVEPRDLRGHGWDHGAMASRQGVLAERRQTPRSASCVVW
jgi:hypothetical protein